MTSAATYVVNAPAGCAANLDYKGDLSASHPLVVRLAGVIGVAPEQLAYITPRDTTVDCGMCNGTGNRPEYAFNGGECYSCDGTGIHAYVTRFAVEYVAADDVTALADFRRHLDTPPGGNLLGWLLSGVGTAPATLTADVI